MRYCFGPVPSRRLGLSLGIDILPLKTCNLNCIYCELGPTHEYTCERGGYSDPDDIGRELAQFLDENQPALDVVTITASGEPTLHTRLGGIIQAVRKAAGRPVAVLTNGTLMDAPSVRESLLKADIVLPSLDAASPQAFRRVNRPCPGLDITRIIEGLISFRKEFPGKMWLEILLVKGVNDSGAELKLLSEAVAAIAPDKVQLNTVARPPAEPWAEPLEYRRLQEVAGLFGGDVEIATSPPAKGKGSYKDLVARIREMLGRRPMTVGDMVKALGVDEAELAPVVESLVERAEAEPVEFGGKRYFKRRSGT